MAEEEVKQDWHWRNSMKVVRFFQFDARAGFALLLVLVHFRLWTLCFAAIVMTFFYLLERKGLTFPASVRAMRVWFIGKKRPAIVFTTRRDLRDFGS